MLYLLFQLGSERYALAASQAVEVLPFVALKTRPHAPGGVAGIINYRGQPLSTVDLCALTLGRPARELLSTRIIVAHHAPTPPPGPETAPAVPPPLQYIGLIVERATGLIRREPGQFVCPGVAAPHTPYLGPVLMDEQGAIQLLQPEHLLSAPVRQHLQAATEPLVT